MKFKFFSLYLLVVLVIVGCSVAPVYKVEVMKDKSIMVSETKQIAGKSSNYLEFVRAIRTSSDSLKQKNSTLYDVIRTKRSRNSFDTYYDTQYFKLFCSENGGKDTMVYGRFYQTFGPETVVMYGCEKNSKITAGLIYDQRRSSKGGYNLATIHADEKGFYEYFEENSLFYYVDRTRTAMLKGSNILEPGAPFYSSDDQKYQVLLKYKNESNAPIVVDYHDSNALIENKNYKIDLTAPSFGRSSISWSFYDNSSQVFSGPQGDSMTQITLNPNQEFTGQLKFAIPGLKILKKAEAENMTLKIGGVEYTGFERMIAYDALMDD